MDTIILTLFNQTLAHPLLDWFMLTLTLLGLVPFIAAGVVLSFQQGHLRRIGWAILVSLSVALFVTLIFQLLAMRPRPGDVRLIWPTPNFYAFPSGHAAIAFAMATVLALSYRKRSWSVIFLSSAALIALSRLYLGHHYPSDVLGGAVLGAAVGASCYGLLVKRERGSKWWRWFLWPQIALVVLISQMAYLNLLPLRLLSWPMADKVLHFFFFGAIVFWLNLWLNGRRIRLYQTALPLALIIGFSVAIIDESLQSLSPLRSSSLPDLTSDIIGMLIFWQLSEAVMERFSDLGAKLET